MVFPTLSICTFPKTSQKHCITTFKWILWKDQVSISIRYWWLKVFLIEIIKFSGHCYVFFRLRKNIQFYECWICGWINNITNISFTPITDYSVPGYATDGRKATSCIFYMNGATKIVFPLANWFWLFYPLL
jgi:hypothetical protein